MFFLAPFLGLIATAAAWGPSFHNETHTVIPNSYIIQLKHDAPTSSLSSRGLDVFHKKARDIDIDYDVRTEFKSKDLFYGLSITVKGNLTAEEVEAKVLDIPSVQAIWPNYLIKALTPQSPFNATAPIAKSSKIKRDAPADGPGYASTLSHITGDVDILSTLKMSQVDKVHALGIKGKGVKIGIVDSGVDYRHPSLGGGFGPGFKVEGGYAFIQDHWDGWSDIVESDDPLTTCYDGGHGTHVAGIIGAEDPEGVGFGLVGVAPEATLYMYRVFSCEGLTTSDILMRALEKAADDGVDLVSCSWGGPWWFAETDPFSLIMSGLAARGIAPVVASGNSGRDGIFATSSPALDPDVISVGSIANTKYPLTYSAIDSRGRDFKYASVWPIETKEPLDVYMLSYGGSPYGCESAEGYADALSKIDVESTVLVVVGSDCVNYGWSQYNFKYVALLNDVETTDPSLKEHWIWYSHDADDEWFINIDGSDSATILSMYKKAGGYGKYKWTFGNTIATAVKQTFTAGTMSNFSSFGIAIDTVALSLKPQLSAPGGNILSTWPLGYLGGYTIISGTSMATPFAAGCYALVKSQFPNLSVKEIQYLLQSTAMPVSTVSDKSILSTTIHQGAGLVNPYQAITFESSISPAELPIGDIDDYINKPKTFTIKNTSNRSKKYIISHQGAGLIEYAPYPDIAPPDWSYLYGLPQYAIYGSVEFSTNQVLLGAGQSIDIQVKFTPPSGAGVVASRQPFYSGYIKVTNNNDHFSIPYVGLPYSRFSADYFDASTNTGFPYPLTTFKYDSNGQNPGEYPQYTVDTDIMICDWSTYENPFISISTFFLSRMMRLDILAANTTFESDIYGYDTNQVIDYQYSSSPFRNTFVGYETYGYFSVVDDPGPYKDWVAWYGRFAYDEEGNGHPLHDGDYRALVSVLRWGGDPEKRESWQTYLSPVIRWINTAAWE